MNTSRRNFSVFKTDYLVFILVFLANIAFCCVASAAPNVAVIEARLDENRSALEKAETILDKARAKRKDSEEKLKVFQDNLAEKEKDLIVLKHKAKEAPTFENEQAVRNEERRIELAGITIKSRIASIVRLENKEQERQREVDRLQALITNDEKILLQTKVELAAEAKLKKQLAQIERERKRERAAAAAEAAAKEERRRKEVALERARLEEERRKIREEEERLEREREENRLAQEEKARQEALTEQRLVEKDEELKKALEQQRANKYGTTLAGSNEQGAANSDGTVAGSTDADEKGPDTHEEIAVILSGPGVDQRYDFDYHGYGKYSVEAIVVDEEAKVTVNGRTYKLQVAREDIGETYIFKYDLTDLKAPKLSLFKKRRPQEDSLARDSSDSF